MEFQILLVEDDTQLQELIVDYFSGRREHSIGITVAGDGDTGMEKFFEQEYDMVFLDVLLPGIDGFTLCQEIRRESTCPIIFLTERGSQEDILYGYDSGCDDYIVKPFSLAELYAKTMALLKRSKGMMREGMLTCGNITLNPTICKVTVSGREIGLAPKEYGLLKCLLEHKGEVISRDKLLIRIWGYDYEGNERVVDNHIKKLRQALGYAGGQIKTVITKGYKIEEDF
jgi:DNA-binding response OmpR family regulator